MSMAIKVVCCYAREDEHLLNKLKVCLTALQRQSLIDVWYDRDILAGAEWEAMISEQLEAAQIILLLVSPDFMASDYCYSKEMKRAMERHEGGEAHVIPVILRHVHWKETPLGRLQALPTDAKPIMGRYWHSLDEAFFDVTAGIRKITRLLSSQESDNPSGDLELSETLDMRTKTRPFIQLRVKKLEDIDTTVLDVNISSLDESVYRSDRDFETVLPIEFKKSIGGILLTIKVEKRNISSE